MAIELETKEYVDNFNKWLKSESGLSGCNSIPVCGADEMNLKQYLKEEDPNKFWRLSPGQHENLLDEAIELLLEQREINKKMHSQVSGYLQGDDWEHWQEFNKERFEI